MDGARVVVVSRRRGAVPLPPSDVMHLVGFSWSKRRKQGRTGERNASRGLVVTPQDRRPHRARGARTVLSCCALGLLAVGCGSAVSTDQQDNEPAAAKAAPGARALLTQARILERKQARKEAAAKRWGLPAAPLAPPAPPADKIVPDTEPDLARGSGEDLPAVISRVPTDDKVVFLTIDDGYEKDPDFLRMTEELDVPFSAFLSDYVVQPHYGYYRRAQRQGNGVHNHTLHHRYLPGLDAEGQRREICGQQDTLEREMGRRPEIFRPPYGNYTRETLEIAASCGIRLVPLWAQEAFPDRIEYRDLDQRLHPGDIILTHFRGREEWDGSMTDMLRRVLRAAGEQGFALARLEDYV